jgi:hypothetical protein
MSKHYNINMRIGKIEKVFNLNLIQARIIQKAHAKVLQCQSTLVDLLG